MLHRLSTGICCRLLPVCLFVLMFGGCVSPVKGLYPPRKGERCCTVFAVSHGWHTGVIFDRAQARDYLPALEDDFSAAGYLEIGWGDEGFYQAKEITSGLTLKAIFWPTDSVLHVVAFDSDPQEYFAGSDLIAISLSQKGFERLIGAINGTFYLDERQQSLRLRKGIYGNSRFYRAKGSYYALRTCNIWTAKVLRESGFPISTLYAVTAGNVMYQLTTYRMPAS